VIRHDCTFADIEAAVDKIDPAWREKAAARTEKFIEDGTYKEASAIWSTVKPVFMRIQRFKCIFCERQFENELYGKIEFDLEHFRPKSSVKSWPNAELHDYVYDFATGDANDNGYYWLPYALDNYAAACKVCNSGLKSNYFPILGPRRTTPGSTQSERQALCYPIGADDNDPAELVTFIATTAVPKAASGAKRRRGQIIIDFFDLNRREQLHRERAYMIILIGNSLAAIDSGIGDDGDDAVVAASVEPGHMHTACVLAYRQLWNSDPVFAKEVLRACKHYFASTAGTMPPGV
jgi:hypothetical protein